MKGHDLIRAERFRQLSTEHYPEEKDVGYSFELCMAAAAYLTRDEEFWPWPEGTFKPKNKMRNLIRAGALIAAAIDALQAEEKIDE